MMWSLIKGYLSPSSIKAALVAVLVAIAALSIFLGWCWISDTRSSLKKHEATISDLNTKIGAKDKQIEVLDIARLAADARADSYAATTEQLNQETKINAQNAQRYKSQSAQLQQQLKEIQRDTRCAREPVPDDVIRMQQKSIADFNAKYSR